MGWVGRDQTESKEMANVSFKIKNNITAIFLLKSHQNYLVKKKKLQKDSSTEVASVRNLPIERNLIDPTTEALFPNT